jgi:DNA-binding transcriptional LysR family regulator
VRLDFRGRRTGRADASAVSRTLSRLEAKLDTTLINRTTRRMDLTEEGKYFFEQAKLILDQMDELEERLSSRQQNRPGVCGINAAAVHAARHRVHRRVSQAVPGYPARAEQR